MAVSDGASRAPTTCGRNRANASALTLNFPLTICSWQEKQFFSNGAAANPVPSWQRLHSKRCTSSRPRAESPCSVETGATGSVDRAAGTRRATAAGDGGGVRREQATHTPATSSSKARTQERAVTPRPSARAMRVDFADLGCGGHALTALHGNLLTGFVPLLQAQLGERLVALGRAD